MNTEDQRIEAERALRRGELTKALASYVALAKAHPEDDALRQKVYAIHALLRAEQAQPPAPPDVDRRGLAAQAEEAVARGDLAAAMGLYRQALAERPDNVLYLERLTQLVSQHRAAGAQPPRARVAPAPRTPRSRQEVLEALLASVLAAGRRAVL